MQQDAAPLTIRGFPIAVAFLLLFVSHVSAEEPHEIYSEMPLSNPRNNQLPLPSADSLHLTSGELSNPRLSDLLLLKQSLLDILSKTPETDTEDYDDDDNLNKSRLTKRVFCNGFTGCGGRFRGRRRQQQPVAEIGKRLLPDFRKRPFCNSYGCYNSGKKRFNPGTAKNEKPKIASLADNWLEDRLKRLFCNSYGGCQNLGKRMMVLDAEVTKAVSGGQRSSFPLTKDLLTKLEGMKRAFSSNFDEDTDDLINNGRRQPLLHSNNSISATISFHRSHMEDLSKVYELSNTIEDPSECYMMDVQNALQFNNNSVCDIQNDTVLKTQNQELVPS